MKNVSHSNILYYTHKIELNNPKLKKSMKFGKDIENRHNKFIRICYRGKTGVIPFHHFLHFYDLNDFYYTCLASQICYSVQTLIFIHRKHLFKRSK